MPPDTENLPRPAWRDALDEVTATHEGDMVTMEVIGAPAGDQIEAETLPLVYVEYDNKDDVVIVAVADRSGPDPVLRHMIPHPQSIFIHPPRPSLAEALDIVADDGTQTIVTMRSTQMT